MDRPDIKNIRASVTECPCHPPSPRPYVEWCDVWGCRDVQPLLDWIDHLERENQRLREALEKIVNYCDNDPPLTEMPWWNMVAIARAALKEGEDG